MDRMVFVFAVLLVAPLSALADRLHAARVHADSNVGAAIISPLMVENVTPLHFGTFYPSPDSTVKISVKTDGLECNHPEVLLSDDQTPAEFHVTGQTNAIYTVELPDQVTLTSETGLPLVADLMPVSPGFLADGEDTFFVGSTMMIPPKQAKDVYSGAFVLTVAYQ